MTNIRITTLLALALTATLAMPASAQVYKWTDKDGKVHYSNEKPPEGTASEVKVDRGPAATPASGAPPNNGGDAAASAPTTAAPNPNAAVAAQVAALDQQRCAAAKAIAASYESAPYLQKKGADGEPQQLSIEDEAAERVKAKADVERLCKGK